MPKYDVLYAAERTAIFQRSIAGLVVAEREIARQALEFEARMTPGALYWTYHNAAHLLDTACVHLRKAYSDAFRFYDQNGDLDRFLTLLAPDGYVVKQNDTHLSFSVGDLTARVPLPDEQRAIDENMVKPRRVASHELAVRLVMKHHPTLLEPHRPDVIIGWEHERAIERQAVEDRLKATTGTPETKEG